MNSIKITRRQFLKWLSASAAVLGLSQTDLLKIKEALAASPVPDPLNPLGPPPHGLGVNAGTLLRVIWIAGAACSGCPTSLLNYLADPADPDPVLNAIANNALHPPLIPVNYPLVDLNALYPGQDGADIDIAEVVLEIITIDYAQIVMAASGDVPNTYLLSLIDSGEPYVLLSEGTIQTAANGKYCRIMDVPRHIAGVGNPWSSYMEEYVTTDATNGVPAGQARTDVTMAGGTLWLAAQPQCLAVIAFGTCATWGGIPAAKGTVTGGKSVWEWLNGGAEYGGNDLGKIIVNVPGCPPNPDWFIATAGAAILELNGLLPGILLNNIDTALDYKGRPKLTYCSPGNTIYHKESSNYKFCDSCPRFPTQPGLATIGACQKKAIQPNGLCLQTMGCNGYRTGSAFVRADCPTRMWNNFEDHSKNNWCAWNNMPCQGCTDPGFPDLSSPFYSKDKNTS